MDHITQKLEVLYDLLVDNFDTVEAELKDLIANPDRIEDTNKFASLLVNLQRSAFIDPLLLQISLSDKEDTWLRDFLYAAIILLEESSVNENFHIPEQLIGKLEAWILDGKQELSWKSATLLKFYENESAERIQLLKLEERGDFFLTYAECILGLLRVDKKKHWDLVKQISVDDTHDEKLREFAKDVIKSC